MSQATEVVRTDIAANVHKRIEQMRSSGEIATPKGYNAGNALRQAWLQLLELKTKDKKPALEVCSKESICNAFLSMCVQGLNPAKKQCYLIPYGNKLDLMRSYFGTMVMTKRIPSVLDVRAQIVYEDDTFDLDTDNRGGLIIARHKPTVRGRTNDKIVGAYCEIILDGRLPDYVEWMEIDAIKTAWSQGYSAGKSDAHSKFTDQMAKKTVINRACKYYANTSDDEYSEMLAHTLDDSDYPEAEPPQPVEYTVEDVEYGGTYSQPEPERDDAQGPAY